MLHELIICEALVLFCFYVLIHCDYRLSYDPSCTVRCTVIDIACRDAGAWVTCVNHTAAADTYCHMIYMAVSRIEDKVAGSCAGYTDLLAYSGLLARSTR